MSSHTGRTGRQGARSRRAWSALRARSGGPRPERLEQKVRPDGDHVQTGRVRNDVGGDPVERERGDLLDRVLVRRVDVAARRERVAVVVLVHPAVDSVVVHQAVHWRVEHVVEHEEEPEGERGIEQADGARRAHDGWRVPQQVRDLLCKDKLDDRVDDEVCDVE